MAAMASQLIQTSVAVPGVQPKLLLEKDALTIAGKGGGNYIIKPPNPDYSQLPENEHVSMLMAKEVFGINTAPHSLIRLSSGELAYITRRMDRTMDGTFIHMLDMFQVLEAYDKYIGSMEKVGRAISLYSSSPLSDAGNYFELVLFCFLTGNNDMHLKNFSMIRNGDFWNLAPAYDLLNVSIANPKDVEEMALTLGGKKRKFSRQYFTDFGLKLGLSVIHINDLFERIKDKVPKVIALLKQSFLTTENQEDYEALFRKRLDMLHIVSRE
ncbi:HipA domain-containing protein [Chitinophaga dinghuensis]|nr:HipA domain-containing protein [Chitinophaga dinghuensis]